MKILDLCCKAGGAAMGLHWALPAAVIIGVDVAPQPHYPFTFVLGDAATFPLEGYDLIWASPPCQRYSRCTPTAYKANHSDLLPFILARLRAQSIPYIVENVPGTQSFMRNPLMLCGTMFGLNLRRHRYFEVGNADVSPFTPSCHHTPAPVLISGVTRRVGRKANSAEERRQALQTPWMSLEEIKEAIPPAYAEYLGRAILPFLPCFR